MSQLDKFEVRAAIKYLNIKGLSTMAIFEDMQKCLEGSAPSYSTVKKWTSTFRRGETSTIDAPRAGRTVSATSQENVDLVQKIIQKDRRSSVRRIAEDLTISKERIHDIIRNHLKMRKVAARWIPKILTCPQKAERVRCAYELLHQIGTKEDFYGRYVTMDETWCYHYEPETKQQSSQWIFRGETPPKKARMSKSAGKVMLSVFWDIKGVIMTDFLEKGCTINGQYYSRLLRKLRVEIKKKRRGMLKRGVLFHHDNAPAHTSALTRGQIVENGFELVPHPPIHQIWLRRTSISSAI